MANNQRPLLLDDVDTGVGHITSVTIPEYAPTHVRITFGRSFSIELEWTDAHQLSEVIHQVTEDAANNDRPNFIHRK